MKKLICLLSVMAIAQVASAGVVIFEGPDTFTIGQLITVNVVADVAAESLEIGAIALNKGSAAPGTLNDGFDYPPIHIFGEQKDGSVGGIFIFQVSGTCSPGTSIEAGQVLYNFTIDTSGLAVGDVIVVSEWIGINPFGGFPLSAVRSKLNGQTVTFDSITITGIPEPMTVALLGLGGLFIRRRK